jgi:hypothetical protein
MIYSLRHRSGCSRGEGLTGRGLYSLPKARFRGQPSPLAESFLRATQSIRAVDPLSDRQGLKKL